MCWICKKPGHPGRMCPDRKPGDDSWKHKPRGNNRKGVCNTDCIGSIICNDVIAPDLIEPLFSCPNPKGGEVIAWANKFKEGGNKKG